MKKIVTEERYEEHGNPACWVWVFIGVVWLMEAVLHMSAGERVIAMAASWLLAAGSFLNAWVWATYELIIDEKGVREKKGLRTCTMAWNEIARVTRLNRISWSMSTGWRFYPIDPAKKPLHLADRPIAALIQRYTELPIEEDG